MNLHYSRSPRLDLTTEYCRNDFLRGEELDRLGYTFQ